MAKATYELTGLDAFIKDVEGLSPKLRAACEPVVERTARRLEVTAQGFAPRREGDLASAIEAQGRGLSWRVGIVDRDIPARGGTNTAHRNPSVYGVWYEVGFLHRRITKHPFMGPALDVVEPSYETDLEAAINGVVP